MQDRQTSPTVSVVIPTYRHRDHVLRTLDSVFAQTFRDFEVVVVNDGSPDDTAERLRPVAEQGRIRYLDQANAGQAAARNAGIQQSRGRFIALLDDDDLWPADKLAWQVEFLVRNPQAGAVAGAALTLRQDGECGPRLPFATSITFESLLLTNPICSPGQTLIRTELLREIGGLQPGIWGADDWDLWLRLIRRAEIALVDRVALHYRVHAGNASRQLGRMFRNCRKVIDAHLPHAAMNDQKRLRRSAYRSLFAFFSGRLVSQAKGDLKAGRFSSAFGALGTLFERPGIIFRQPSLLTQVIRHFAV